jgi:hypothetical protein
MADNEEQFKTHIKEPRWQQVVSLIIMIGILGVEIWIAVHGGV